MAVVFLCGAECAVLGDGNAGSMGGVSTNGHWQTIDSSSSVDTTFVAPGGSLRSYRLAPGSPAGARKFQRDLTAQRVSAARIKMMWTTVPTASGLVVWFDGTNLRGVRYNTANSSLELYDKTGGTSTVGPVVVAGHWYTIEMLWDTNANPWTGSWRVDGVPYGSLSVARAAEDAIGFDVGNWVSLTQTVYFDDMIVGNAATDYPFGDGVVLSLSPRSDGLHSFTANDFKYNNSTAFSQTATDVSTYLDDTPDNVTDYISQAVVRSTGYVEVRFAGLPFWLPDGKAIKTINAVALIGGFHATAGQACTCSLRVVDGGTETAVFALLSPGNSSIVNYCKVYTTSPTASLPWTRGTLNALLARFGFSTDVSPVPSCDALMLEVDCATTPALVGHRGLI